MRQGHAREIARKGLMLQGVDIPSSVSIGRGFDLRHRGVGTVISNYTVIMDDVTIFHNVQSVELTRLCRTTRPHATTSS